MKDLYPFEGRTIDLEGLRLHTIDEGSGEPVVMLHGNPTWSFYYRRLALELRETHRVIVPDHIGCGLSEKPGDDRYAYTLERRVRDLEALLERLGARDRITLVLHDWGGMIGMAYAVRHPRRIARIVVMNTAAFHLPEGKRFPWALRICRAPLLGALLVRGLNLFARGAARTGTRRRPLPRDVRAGYLAPYDSWANRIAIHRFVQDIPLRPGDRSYDLVSRVDAGLEVFRDTPVLILWGERDFVFDHQFLAEWQRRLPAAEVVRFPDAGHYVLEDAFEEIAAAVRRFLGVTARVQA